MRILITGGAGFIGSHLCDILLELETFMLGILQCDHNVQHKVGGKSRTSVQSPRLDSRYPPRNQQKGFDTQCCYCIYLRMQ